MHMILEGQDKLLAQLQKHLCLHAKGLEPLLVIVGLHDYVIPLV